MKRRFELVREVLDERSCRRWAGAEAIAAGKGGTAAVARVAKMSRNRVGRGVRECQESDGLAPGRVRLPGGGRKRETDKDSQLLPSLEALVEPATRGDPESPLRWTVKSARTLSAELTKQGHHVGKDLVHSLLRESGYSLQANRKTKEGADHPDRNAQFEHISREAAMRLAANEPVISVDTKKKELVGEFKNNGRNWLPKGEPVEVNVHDFPDLGIGKAVPYGIYDLARNTGWISLGVSHDTATFAVETVRRWWYKTGVREYPAARSLMITADCGGSNGARLRLWKWELQKFANETGITISVNHLPPGTSKWNKIEHRLFSFISQNWRGKPLVSFAVILNHIAATTTKKGLKVDCEIDPRIYDIGERISDQQMRTLHLERNAFHGDWNYAIRPSVS